MWINKNLASRSKYEIFRVLIRLHLVSLARLLLYPLSAYYALCPSIRKRYSYYLEHRFGSSKGLRGFVRTTKAYKNFADILLDRVILATQGTISVKQHASTIETLKNILSEGRGCLLVSAHFGCWQTGLYGLESLGSPIHLVQWVDENEIEQHYFRIDGGRHCISIIDSRNRISAGMEIQKALKNNGIVCFMGDRLAPEDKNYISVPFLNEAIHLPSAPYVIASATGAPVLHTSSIRQNAHVLGLPCVVTRVPPNIRKNRVFLEYAACRFAKYLENLTSQYPYHFFNFYNLWSRQ